MGAIKRTARPRAKKPADSEKPAERVRLKATFASSEQRHVTDIGGASVTFVLRPAREQERLDTAATLSAEGLEQDKVVVAMARIASKAVDVIEPLLLRIEGLVESGAAVTLPVETQDRRDLLLRFDIGTLSDLMLFVMNNCHGLAAEIAGN